MQRSICLAAFVIVTIATPQTALAQGSKNYPPPSAGNKDDPANSQIMQFLIASEKKNEAFRTLMTSEISSIKSTVQKLDGRMINFEEVQKEHSKEILWIKGKIVTIEGDIVFIKGELTLVKDNQVKMQAQLDRMDVEFKKAKDGNQIININVRPTASFVPPTVIVNQPVFYYYPPAASYYCYYNGYWYNYYPSGYSYYYYANYHANYNAYSPYAQLNNHFGVQYRTRWWHL